MKKLLIFLLTFILLNVSDSNAKLMKKEEIKSYIYNLDLFSAHIRICYASPVLCKVSANLYDDFYPYINRMYYSVVKHESINFRYRQGLKDRYDYGLPQVNIRFWTKSKLHTLGYELKTLEQLRYDDKLALDVGFTIFWYNIVYGFYHGTRYRAIVDYVGSYHSPASNKGKNVKCYIRKVKANFYKVR